ncbi:lipid droplet-associated hydrolase isoform 3-T4 [Menidia menidia]
MDPPPAGEGGGGSDPNGPHSEFIYCCGAATELLKFGPRQLRPGTELLVLVIPGNPGVVGFYRTFMETLYLELGGRHPVWAVSHAGHCNPPDHMDILEDGGGWAGPPDPLGLDGQVRHKLAFVRRALPAGAGLLLIGHSIGCWVALEMLRRAPRLPLRRALLLFPTIQHMAHTPQGRLMTPLLVHVRYLAYLPVFLLSLLPAAARAALVRLALGRMATQDPWTVGAAVELLSGDCAANALYLGGQEMKRVQQRDDHTIRDHLHRLVFYYGAADPWCPVRFYRGVREAFPRGDVHLCGRGLRHAFVLDAGQEVARMVATWVREAPPQDQEDQETPLQDQEDQEDQETPLQDQETPPETPQPIRGSRQRTGGGRGPQDQGDRS